MKVGEQVRVRFTDASTVTGQVWADGPTVGTMWLALDGGKFLLVYTDTGDAYTATPRGVRAGDPVGKVAA